MRWRQSVPETMSSSPQSIGKVNSIPVVTRNQRHTHTHTHTQTHITIKGTANSSLPINTCVSRHVLRRKKVVPIINAPADPPKKLILLNPELVPDGDTTLKPLPEKLRQFLSVGNFSTFEGASPRRFHFYNIFFSLFHFTGAKCSRRATYSKSHILAPSRR